MAYLDQTLENNYQSRVAEKEIRIPNYGLIDAAKVQTPQVPFLSNEVRTQIETRSGTSVIIPAFTEDVITTSTSESFTIPANLSTSGTTTLTLTTIFAGFAIYPETFDNQIIGEEEYRSNKIQEVDKAMAAQLESYIDTHLGTYKTAVWSGTLPGFSFASNALDVSLDQQNDVMFANLGTLAEINDWNIGTGIMVSEPEIGFVMSQLLKYGANNEKNLLYQSIPSVYTSNNVTKQSGKRWTGYLMEPGAIGIVPNFKRPFREQLTIGEAMWDISDGEMPQLGHRVMLYQNREKVSAVGIGSYSSHAIMSWKEEYGYVFRFCLLKRYNSDSTTKVGSILKINGLNT